MNLNIYEKLYLGIYSSLSRTNKSIPEWSTIISISILLFFNIFTILELINFNFKEVEKNTFKFGILIIIIINWFYFLKGNRIIKKLRQVKYELKIFEKIIVGMYCYGTIILFFLVLNVGIKYTSITIGSFLIMQFLVYKFGGKPIKLE